MLFVVRCSLCLFYSLFGVSWVLVGVVCWLLVVVCCLLPVVSCWCCRLLLFVVLSRIVVHVAVCCLLLLVFCSRVWLLLLFVFGCVLCVSCLVIGVAWC